MGHVVKDAYGKLNERGYTPVEVVGYLVVGSVFGA